MASKKNPGSYDCYANAEHDEEMFILLARDVAAPWVVEFWRAIRAHDVILAERIAREAVRDVIESGKKSLRLTSPKSLEASSCALQMKLQRNETCNATAPICNQRCNLPRFHDGDHQCWALRELGGEKVRGLVSGWPREPKTCGSPSPLHPTRIICGREAGHQGDHQWIVDGDVRGFWTNKEGR